MPANNPNGVNGYYDVGGQESPYGAIKRLEESTKAAPIPPAPGIAAPKRAQRAAVKGKQAQPGDVAPDQPLPPVAVEERELSPQEIWAAVAQIPGITPLAAEYARA